MGAGPYQKAMLLLEVITPEVLRVDILRSQLRKFRIQSMCQASFKYFFNAFCVYWSPVPPISIPGIWRVAD